MTRLRCFAALLFIVIWAFCPTGTTAADEVTATESPESLDEVKSPEERAQIHRERGDLLVSRDDYEGAAEAYIEALACGGCFTEEERLRMALCISWADQYQEAIAEYRSILSANPDNNVARIHLARTLSWDGRSDEAIDEADRALDLAPDDRDALLVRANALSWKGKSREAMPIYRMLLAEEEDFDTRLGMTHALLSQGKITEARASSKGLVPEPGYQTRKYERLSSALNEVKSPEEQAQIHREQGDLLVSRDDYAGAAKAYIEALACGGCFTEEERLRMALHISWADRYDEAIAEYRSILSADPDNNAARIHLARTLSWDGQLDEAIAEADRALDLAPDDRDAFLVKANALSWKGKSREAMPIYRMLLAEEEDFDTRLGITHTLLSQGRITEARASSKGLVPEPGYQTREYERLADALKGATRSSMEGGYGHYSDNEDNRLDRFTHVYQFRHAAWTLGLTSRFTRARNIGLENRSVASAVTAYLQVSDAFGIGGGAGFHHLDNDRGSTWPAGYASLDLDLGRWRIGAGASRDAFAETAQLIENKIQVTRARGFLSTDITRKLSLDAGYGHADYSDDNSSNEISATLAYAVRSGNPKVEIGYRSRYLDFGRQSESGYFDPDDFLSHQGYLSLHYEDEALYFYAETYGGHQTFDRYGEENDDILFGGYGSLGLKLTKKVTFEINGEGGNFAVETATGYRYYYVGTKLKVLF